MYLVVVVIFTIFSEVEPGKWVFPSPSTHLLEPVNRGRLRTGPKEIAYGDIVDYSSLKRNYPFMSRLLFDDLRCGGALISDRCILRNTSYSYICRHRRTQSY